jgi:hypothetical protein
MMDTRMSEHLMLVVGQGYLKSYDREAYDGRGAATYTDDPAEAMRFPTEHCVRALADATPRCKPLRDDGQPNRPLSAYTLIAVPVADHDQQTTSKDDYEMGTSDLWPELIRARDAQLERLKQKNITLPQSLSSGIEFSDNLIRLHKGICSTRN